MPYILNKTNGSIVTTVQDAALDSTTDLTFLGRNFAGYGEVQNENFLKLLENFSNSTAPSKPVEGQLWFNNNTKKINVYDSTSWKSIANMDVTAIDPVGTKNFTIGDLWFNSETAQLHGYNGSNFVLIGPISGDDIKANWKGSREYSIDEGLTSPKFSIKAVVGTQNEVIAVVSNESFTLSNFGTTYPIFDKQPIIKKGITLIGSGTTGNSEAAGNYFWGSASHAVYANTSTYTLGVTPTLNTSTNISYGLPFISSTSTRSIAFYDPTGINYNPSTKTLTTTIFSGVATSAFYADLAERYAADAIYTVGTVVIIGGEKDITVTNIRANTAVAGIISEHPGHMMNSAAGPNETHPYVALRGRVPCKVIGSVKKGQLLVTSTELGYAEAFAEGDDPNSVLGKSLQNFNGIKGVVEVLV